MSLEVEIDKPGLEPIARSRQKLIFRTISAAIALELVGAVGLIVLMFTSLGSFTVGNEVNQVTNFALSISSGIMFILLVVIAFAQYRAIMEGVRSMRHHWEVADSGLQQSLRQGLDAHSVQLLQIDVELLRIALEHPELERGVAGAAASAVPGVRSERVYAELLVKQQFASFRTAGGSLALIAEGLRSVLGVPSVQSYWRESRTGWLRGHSADGLEAEFARAVDSVLMEDGRSDDEHASIAGNGSTELEAGAEEFSVGVYLEDEADAATVKRAVEEYLEAIGAEILDETEPVIGSWKWFAKAKRASRAAASSELGKDTGTLLTSLAWGPARTRQAEVNFTNSQAVASLLGSLQSTSAGVIWIGGLLAVKSNNTPIVVMLNQAQVNELERSPSILNDPATILERLQQVQAESSATPFSALQGES